MNAYLDRLDEQIAARHVLTHPFYLAWTRGELHKATLADYACQYYRHVAAFPTYLSALHARCDDQPTRRQLLANLIDEEAGDPNHPQLWRNFAATLGVSPDELDDAALWPLVDPDAAGRAAIHAAGGTADFGRQGGQLVTRRGRARQARAGRRHH